MSKRNITFYNQGCRLNQAETAILERSFEADGYRVMQDQPSDIVVVNTCTVTENGDRDTRQLVNRINRENPNVKIALVGCQAQILKEELLKLPNVNWVIGNAQKMNLTKIINTDETNVVIAPKIERKSFTLPISGIDRRHTRANLKVQDGCDFYCAFCIIPFARGPARSRDFSDAIREAIELVAAGHKELVLTGINLGTYHFKGKSIFDLIKALNRIQGLERIRISSIEPTTIPDELVSLMGSSKLCRYFHVPIQSASNAMLKAMNRHYNLEEYDAFLKSVFEVVPDAGLGTDVIVGFPGETDAHFQETVDYLASSPLSYFHVFSYSERRIARSRKLSGKIEPSVIQERSRILRALSQV
ncbi:MAG: tRNA (N(6)-L-threonylcarbamoyladenosine(37)-C(2))-methylthiotransferase MtaB, partial [Candidatus Margulisbacteria bacterium]|nr:tRNA (N(6)-L-threonylcarbamoyladenosine(37)-C(2))-methylthiotransferase MtaB [Candidatus Margulisiibacteriota bacterium]